MYVLRDENLNMVYKSGGGDNEFGQPKLSPFNMFIILTITK